MIPNLCPIRDIRSSVDEGSIKGRAFIGDHGVNKVPVGVENLVKS